MGNDMIHNNMLELVGNTPMVRINKINPNPDVEILAKLEKYNASGSVKDRIAVAMIEDAEKKGLLDGKKAIIEATSGNTGIGLAMVGSIKGYKVILVMPKCVSEERIKILQSYGAEVWLTSGEKGIDGSIRYVQKLVKEEPDKYIHLNQYDNPANILAHYQHTANEILKDTNGLLNMFIAGLGTTGTVCGIGKRLKEHDKRIRVIAVEPKDGASIQGLKNLETQIKPKIYDPLVIDEIVKVGEAEAYQTARDLVRKEGIFVGMSSGASMYVALQKAKEMKIGRIVVILPDGGEKYLSTDLFSTECDTENP